MKFLSCPVLSWLGVSLMLLASQAHATVVLSNLGETNYGSGGGAPIAKNHDLGTENTTYVGSSFIVGSVAGGLWNLDSVTLSMDAANPGTTGAFSVAIYANNVDRPGTRLGALTGNTSPTTANNYTYTATPGSIQLTQGTQYWLVAEAPNTTGFGQGYFWNLSTTTNYTTQSSGWSVDPTRVITSFDDGYQSDTGSWFDDNTSAFENVVYRTTSASGSAKDLGIDSFLQFSLSASQASGVPEPSRTLLLLGGLLGLGLRRKRALAC